MLTTNDILAALRKRVEEYERIRSVCTGDVHGDKYYNHAMDMVINDLKELIVDADHAEVHAIPLIRVLHAVN